MALSQRNRDGQVLFERAISHRQRSARLFTAGDGTKVGLIDSILVLHRGPGGNRTRDILLAKQVLYQLSYRPFCSGGWIRTTDFLGMNQARCRCVTPP